MIVHIRVLDEHIFVDADNASSTSMRKQLSFGRLLVERVLALDHLVRTILIVDYSTTVLVDVLPQEILLIR